MACSLFAVLACARGAPVGPLSRSAEEGDASSTVSFSVHTRAQDAAAERGRIEQLLKAALIELSATGGVVGVQAAGSTGSAAGWISNKLCDGGGGRRLGYSGGASSGRTGWRESPSAAEKSGKEQPLRGEGRRIQEAGKGAREPPSDPGSCETAAPTAAAAVTATLVGALRPTPGSLPKVPVQCGVGLSVQPGPGAYPTGPGGLFVRGRCSGCACTTQGTACSGGGGGGGAGGCVSIADPPRGAGARGTAICGSKTGRYKRAGARRAQRVRVRVASSGGGGGGGGG
ncbi:hypothetical protein T492DRAFT_1142850, partial [Pavlovales sp. CCMP2436]